MMMGFYIDGTPVEIIYWDMNWMEESLKVAAWN
jgi:hypothetical protein